jgi:Protein of unknown function (DUF3307)
MASLADGNAGARMIDSQAALVLWALLAFQTKHLLCDFVFQTKFQVVNKGFYGRMGGLLHAGCHALFTVPVLLILTRSPPLITAIALGEFVLHYHIDWLKARTERVRDWNDTQNVYWAAFGIDQFLHQITYLGIVALLLRLAAP